MDKQTIARNVKLALRNVGVDTKVITIKKDEIIIKGELCEENTDNVAFDFWKETGEDIYTDQDGEPITKEMDIERIPSISVT